MTTNEEYKDRFARQLEAKVAAVNKANAEANRLQPLWPSLPTPGIDACDRNSVIKAIKDALQKRSGKAWSVTGGRGTAWGWIHIDAPPARRTWKCREKPGADYSAKWSDQWEEYDTGEAGHSTGPHDREELAKLLGIETSFISGGVGVPASSEYRREYLDRAQGKTPSVIGSPYWD